MRTETAGRTPTPKRRARRPRILALGLGNLLLGDDGAGVHAVRRLREARLPGVLAVDVGTAVLDALHLIERADCLLAVDALRAGGAPGTLYALALDSVRDDGVRYSAHELSLVGALRLARRQPPEIVVLAVEPGRIDFSDQLSKPVARALPGLVAAAQRVLEGWRTGTLRLSPD
jgi:hydrogenase maturation protease